MKKHKDYSVQNTGHCDLCYKLSLNVAAMINHIRKLEPNIDLEVLTFFVPRIDPFCKVLDFLQMLKKNSYMVDLRLMEKIENKDCPFRVGGGEFFYSCRGDKAYIPFGTSPSLFWNYIGKTKEEDSGPSFLYFREYLDSQSLRNSSLIVPVKMAYELDGTASFKVNITVSGKLEEKSVLGLRLNFVMDGKVYDSSIFGLAWETLDTRQEYDKDKDVTILESLTYLCAGYIEPKKTYGVKIDYSYYVVDVRSPSLKHGSIFAPMSYRSKNCYKDLCITDIILSFYYSRLDGKRRKSVLKHTLWYNEFVYNFLDLEYLDCDESLIIKKTPLDTSGVLEAYDKDYKYFIGARTILYHNGVVPIFYYYSLIGQKGMTYYYLQNLYGRMNDSVERRKNTIQNFRLFLRDCHYDREVDGKRYESDLMSPNDIGNLPIDRLKELMINDYFTTMGSTSYGADISNAVVRVEPRRLRGLTYTRVNVINDVFGSIGLMIKGTSKNGNVNVGESYASDFVTIIANDYKGKMFAEVESLVDYAETEVVSTLIINVQDSDMNRNAEDLIQKKSVLERFNIGDVSGALRESLSVIVSSIKEVQSKIGIRSQSISIFGQHLESAPDEINKDLIIVPFNPFSALPGGTPVKFVSGLGHLMQDSVLRKVSIASILNGLGLNRLFQEFKENKVLTISKSRMKELCGLRYLKDRDILELVKNDRAFVPFLRFSYNLLLMYFVLEKG